MNAPNIIELAELVNIAPAEKTFFEAFPINLEECILRYANKRDSTCIYIKWAEYKMIQGGIILWHGTVANIPAEYALCDGNNGTPDLRDKFVVGAPDGEDPGGGGGSNTHDHLLTIYAHDHDLVPGTNIAAGTDYDKTTDPTTPTIDVVAADSRPPFYEIAYIMKL